MVAGLKDFSPDCVCQGNWLDSRHHAMVDCQHRRRGRDRGDRRRLGADVTLGRPYIDCIDRIALCAAAGAFALARDQAMPELLPGRYAFALELCSTKSDVPILLPRVLDETSSMRKPAVERTTRPKPKSDLVATPRPLGSRLGGRASKHLSCFRSFARAAGHPGFGLLGKAIANRYADFCRLASGAFVLHVARPIAAHPSRALDSMLRRDDFRNFPI
jgi:hypothetical protein